jgi:hypothetical protein
MKGDVVRIQNSEELLKRIPINLELMILIKNFAYNLDTYGPIGS